MKKNGKILHCDYCGKKIYLNKSRIERVKNHFCCIKCSNLFKRNKLKTNQPKGLYRTTTRKRSDGTVQRLYHRAIMEEFLGRKLLRNEIIHHKNGNRYDNRIENLLLTTQGEHNKIQKEKLQIVMQN